MPVNGKAPSKEEAAPLCFMRLYDSLNLCVHKHSSRSTCDQSHYEHFGLPGIMCNIRYFVFLPFLFVGFSASIPLIMSSKVLPVAVPSCGTGRLL